MDTGARFPQMMCKPQAKKKNSSVECLNKLPSEALPLQWWVLRRLLFCCATMSSNCCWSSWVLAPGQPSQTTQCTVCYWCSAAYYKFLTAPSLFSSLLWTSIISFSFELFLLLQIWCLVPLLTRVFFLWAHSSLRCSTFILLWSVLELVLFVMVFSVFLKLWNQEMAPTSLLLRKLLSGKNIRSSIGLLVLSRSCSALHRFTACVFSLFGPQIASRAFDANNAVGGKEQMK